MVSACALKGGTEGEREGEEVGEVAAGDGVSSLVRALIEEDFG